MARQKEFDRDEVLHKTMEVFWARGYEATSIQDLVKHMGINRQSIYDRGQGHPISAGLIFLGRSGTYVPETE